MSIFRRRRAMRLADLLRDYPGDRFDVLGTDDLMAVADAVQEPQIVEDAALNYSLRIFTLADFEFMWENGVRP